MPIITEFLLMPLVGYPNREKTKSLAEQVIPLAGNVVESKRRRQRTPDAKPEAEVTESWREALRLLVAECKDDDVDDVLLAILKPASGEDETRTKRPRVVLAALCLADEPNSSEETALKILDHFVGNVQDGDAGGHFRSSLSVAGSELGKCMWAGELKQRLMGEFIQRQPNERVPFGSLWAMIESQGAPDENDAFQLWLGGLQHRLESVNEIERTSAALTVMMVAFREKAVLVPRLVDSLLALLSTTPPARQASAWALGWLGRRAPAKWNGTEPLWRPEGEVVGTLIEILRSTARTEYDTVRWLLTILGLSRDSRAVLPSIEHLHDANKSVRLTVAGVLAQLGDKQAVVPLLAKLDDHDPDVRQAVIEALAQLGDKQAVVPLLAKLDDQDSDVRQVIIKALAQLGDHQAVAPLLTKLNDQDPIVRQAVIEALAQLGDNHAIVPLLAKLDDQDPDVRQATIKALAQLGNIQAVAPLLTKLNDQDPNVGVTAALAIKALGDPEGGAALTRFLTADDVEIRQAAVRTYARQKDFTDQLLLSRDLDASDPWLDPSKPVSDVQVTKAVSRLDISPEQVRSRFEIIAGELNLKLDWKP